MTRRLVCIVLALSLLNFYYSVCYSAGDERKVQSQTPYTPHQQPPHPQGMQPPRPILPPVVPSTYSGGSPTPSPHIASPPVTPSAISMQSFNEGAQSQKAHIYKMPSSPINVPVSISDGSTQLPQVPIIGNSVGEVISKSSEKDGALWIEVKDDLFNQTLKIKVESNKTPIMKKITALGFNDIKIGDNVNVIFSQQGEENIATFISILSEEDNLSPEK